jgi:hypothetical protein
MVFWFWVNIMGGSYYCFGWVSVGSSGLVLVWKGVGGLAQNDIIQVVVYYCNGLSTLQ